MKRTCFIITLLVIVFFVSVNASAQSGNTSITLNSFLKQAELNNKQVRIDDLEIKAKESQLEQAKENAAMAGDTYGPADVLNSRIRKEVKVAEAQADLEVARMTKKDNLEQLLLDIRKVYCEILLAEKELDNEKQKLQFAKERLDIAKTKYLAEMITKNELDSAEYELFSKTIAVESVNDKIIVLDMKLKGLLDLPLGGERLVLTGNIVQDKFVEVDIDKIVSDNLEKGKDVYSAFSKYNAALKTMMLTEELFKPGNITYDRNKVSLEATRRDYESAKGNRETYIRNTYNELLNLKDEVDLAIRYEELQKNKSDTAKVKYEKGQISKDAYLNTIEGYIDAVYNRYYKLHLFNVKNGEFLNIYK
jgi:hypothetical protein